mmetsp:Transcript_27150/g.74457  ORF Transcript_27150/g.74457 Transcript_27150/m.74457 type:complete len:80 (-) Transcript_27150:948-1187(-)
MLGSSSVPLGERAIVLPTTGLVRCIWELQKSLPHDCGAAMTFLLLVDTGDWGGVMTEGAYFLGRGDSPGLGEWVWVLLW